MTNVTSSAQKSLQEWFSQPLGIYLLGLEKKVLDTILRTCFGYYLLKIGGANTASLLDASPIHEKMILQDFYALDCNVIGKSEALPLESNSIDVMVVSHLLEFCEDPHLVLREIERVLRPEGYLILFSFNPWGWYGVRRFLCGWFQAIPWRGRYFGASKLTDWLKLLGISVLSHRRIAAVPPINHARVLQFLSPLDRWFSGFSWVPMSGVNVLLAKKQVSTLTPIQPSWWQRSILGERSNALRPTTRNQS